MEKLWDAIIAQAKALGAESPAIEEDSEGNAVVICTMSGRIWRIGLAEMK